MSVSSRMSKNVMLMVMVSALLAMLVFELYVAPVSIKAQKSRHPHPPTHANRCCGW